ncbi:MAG: hypothetical protein R2788_08250 [Saprospiraceae bacterium]
MGQSVDTYESYEFTIVAPSGMIDAFGLGDGDGCTISWTASEKAYI